MTYIINLHVVLIIITMGKRNKIKEAVEQSAAFF